MNKVTYFNTSIGSLNVGDQIINEAVRRELSDIWNGKFILELPTHTPIIHAYQSFKQNPIVDYCDKSDLKFIAGTNIIANNNLRPWPNWNVNIFNYRPYVGSVCVGVGTAPNSEKMNTYSRWLYTRILSDDYIHSARDERTKKLLESMGLKAINTGCPTLWGLNSIACSKIKTSKSRNAIFTLTDYSKDRNRDLAIINCLLKNYEKVYFWPQGSGDMAYIKELKQDNLNILAPQLDTYRAILEEGDIDYVGTRLHAGIFAMQHGIRSLIVIVDNRTLDMQSTYNINAIDVVSVNELEGIVNSNFSTNIKINEANITKWKNQFK